MSHVMGASGTVPRKYIIAALSAAALFVSTLLLGGQPQSRPAQTQPAAVNPYDRFSRPRTIKELPAHAVGILVSDQSFDFCVDEMIGHRRTPWTKPPDVYRYSFSRDGVEYRRLWWHSDDATRAITVSEPVVVVNGHPGNRQFSGVCEADTTSGKAKGIEPPFSLVEIEVNGGLGSPGITATIVATDLKLIHKTAAYPLDPRKVWDDASARLKKYKETNADPLEKTMADLEIKALADKKATGPRETWDHALITWLPKSERVRIEFQSVTTDGAYKDIPKHTVGPTGGGDAIRLVPGVRTGTQFGVTGGMVVEFAKDGTLAKEEQFPLERFIAPYVEQLPR